MCSTKYLIVIVAIILCGLRLNLAQDVINNSNGTTTVVPPMANNSEVTITNTTNFGDMGVYKTPTRIVGGRLVDIEEVPYQVALFRDNFFICGGAIVSMDWIVTTAHCVYGGGSFGIRYGTSSSGGGGHIRFFTTIVINGGYNSLTLANDIAMLRTHKPFTWSEKVQPIRLATEDSKVPKKLFITGWGSVGENAAPVRKLRGAEVTVVSHKECRSSYRRIFAITDSMLCANATGTDACKGDSGGPLSKRGVLYGITSFGIGCARPNFPGVYTDIRRQYKWIRNVVRRNGGELPLLLE